jgi:hypothetical protein
MSRLFLFAALLIVSSLGHFGGNLHADEIVIGNRPNQRSLADVGLDQNGNPDNSRLITAGELWQFFHDRGVTTVDQLTLNLDCGGMTHSQSGPIRFQIQDPLSGNLLTNLSIESSGNKLEVPLDFDYMKRFSPGSKELIRLDLTELDALASNAKVSVDSDSHIFGPLNVLLITGFFTFWVLVFFVLNRFTKPIRQEDQEDIIVRSTVVENMDGDDLEPVVATTGSVNSQARTLPAISIASPGTRPGQNKMVSAQ